MSSVRRSVAVSPRSGSREPEIAAFPPLSCVDFLLATITRHQYARGRRARNPSSSPFLPRSPPSSSDLLPHFESVQFLSPDCGGSWERLRCPLQT
ncbi:unnamed protein product [Danaus chrysippus]|uniref:(African queen) hypothetical protein n=1 Tax=Danaus chrysippus TaxID=151541 RepID=A0A8J2R5L3_9NEOP|nr:unnamed protein product [Danaus chrysippus]